MSAPRSRARVLTVTGLYQLDLLQKTMEEVVRDVRERVDDHEDSLYYLKQKDRSAALDFFESLLRGTWEKKEEIDTRIQDNLDNWKLERVGHIERAILRLGCHELLHREDIPTKVSFNEMLELSKSFCDKKSKNFVNGVLDAIAP